MKPEPMQHANALPNNTSPLVKWFDEYGNMATGVVCVAMIVGAIWYSYTRTSTSRSETAWASFSQAKSAEDFGNIADLYEGSEVGNWARLSEGERHLDAGMALMFTDRKGGLGDLDKADQAFRKVLSGKPNPLTRERALWGLAKSTEAQSGEDTTQAITAYSKLLSDFPNSTYKAIAEQRVEALKSNSAKEFYAWFQKQNPAPPDLKKPADGLPEGHPSIGKSSKDLSSEDDTTDSEKPKDGEKTEDKKDEKKDDEKKPEAKDGEATKESPKKSVVDRLSAPTEANFEKTPLVDITSFLSESLGVEVSLDSEGLKTGGFTKNMQQTLSIEKSTGLRVVEALLTKYASERDPLVLVIQESENKAVITTKSAAEKAKWTPFAFPKPAESKAENKDAPADKK